MVAQKAQYQRSISLTLTPSPAFLPRSRRQGGRQLCKPGGPPSRRGPAQHRAAIAPAAPAPPAAAGRRCGARGGSDRGRRKQRAGPGEPRTRVCVCVWRGGARAQGHWRYCAAHRLRGRASTLRAAGPQGSGAALPALPAGAGSVPAGAGACRPLPATPWPALPTPWWSLLPVLHGEHKAPWLEEEIRNRVPKDQEGRILGMAQAAGWPGQVF